MLKKRQKEKFHKSAILLLILAILPCLLIMLLSGCRQTEDSAEDTERVEDQFPSPSTAPQPLTAEEPYLEEAPLPYSTEATLLAVGDIMMHSPQLPSGYDPKTKSYNFDAFFREVKDILSAGDWVIGNLETPLAGIEAGYSGYPQFNAPAELADALNYAGFNILTTANNHSLDRREKGVLRTLENVRSRGLLPIGTAATSAEANKPSLVTKNEITMGILAYTYGTNGIPVPEGKDYLVSLIDEQKIIEDIGKLRGQGVDVVTVALHFGTEYQLNPNEDQIHLVHRLIQAGADIILGSHPHVVQPYDWVETEKEDGTKRKGIVIYSLGNFISNQDRAFTHKPTDIGVIFSLQIKKHFPEETIEIFNVETTPTYVHRYFSKGKRQYRVLPMEAVLASKNDPILGQKDYQRLEGYLAEMNKHLQSLAVPVDQPSTTH